MPGTAGGKGKKAKHSNGNRCHEREVQVPAEQDEEKEEKAVNGEDDVDSVSVSGKKNQGGQKNIIGHLLSANLFQTTFSHNINPDGDQFKFSMIKVNCKANSDLHHRP